MKKKLCFKFKDVTILFEFICLLYLIFSTLIFVLYAFNKPYPNIDLEKFASTLNVAIAMVGLSEGIRSFNKTASSEIGESSPLPAYKISFLIKILIIFTLISLVLISFEIYCKNYISDCLEKPNFATDEMINCILSNFLAYLFAKYGNKLGIDIDLSGLSFFKKKNK